jgi:hypothetical protein
MVQFIGYKKSQTDEGDEKKDHYIWSFPALAIALTDCQEQAEKTYG